MYRNDPDLIKACLNGDEAAWNELVERYARLVYSIALRYGLSSIDADDVFQNVFTIVFRRLSSLRNQKLLAAWLITITSRECQRLRRRNPEAIEMDESIPDGGHLPHDEAQILERRHLVRTALDQLDPRCRELLIALFLDPSEQSYEKIASRLGMPVGSIGPTRARCFKKLEAILGEMDIDFDT